jgi:hypothetical protein
MSWRDAPLVTGDEAWAQAPMAAPSGPSTRRPGRADPTRRAQLEGELAENQAASDAAGQRLAQLEPFEEPVRQAARAAVLPGRGVTGIGAMLEAGVTTPMSMATGREVRGPARMAYDALSPPELAPRNGLEQAVDFIGEGIAGGGAGNIVARGVERLARTGSTTQRVARTVAESPKADVYGGAGAGLGMAGANAADLGPGGELAAALLGGIAGARAGGGFTPGQPAPRAPGAAHTVSPANPIELARSLDYKLSPTTSVSKGGTTKGRLRESVSNPQQVQDYVALENQKNSDTRFRRLLKLGQNDRLSAENYERARAPHNAVYDELRDRVRVLEADPVLGQQMGQVGEELLSNPLLRNTTETSNVAGLRDLLTEVVQDNIPTDKVIQAIRQFRKRGTRYMQSMDDPAKMELGESYRTAADALEDALERAATRYGDEGLVTRFRQARQELAKTHDMEAVTVGESVDLGRLKALGDKRPLTGELAAMRDVAIHFGKETRFGPDVRVPNPQSITLFGMGKRAAQRNTTPFFTRELLSDDFQTQNYGPVDPNPGPGSILENYFPQPRSPDAPPAPPSGPGGGPVDFSPTPGLPPAAALRSRAADLADDLDLAPEPVPNPQALPEAPPALSARTPPPMEGVPFQGTPQTARAGNLALADDFAGYDDLRGGVPPRPTPDLDPPPAPPAPGAGLADDIMPPLSDTDLLRLQLEGPAAELGILPGQRRPPPGAEPPAAAPVEPPPPRGGPRTPNQAAADQGRAFADDMAAQQAAQDADVAWRAIDQGTNTRGSYQRPGRPGDADAPVAEAMRGESLADDLLPDQGRIELNAETTLADDVLDAFKDAPPAANEKRFNAAGLALVDDAVPAPARRDIEVKRPADVKPTRKAGNLDVYEDVPPDLLRVGGEDVAVPKGARVYAEGPLSNAKRAIVVEEKDGEWFMRRTNVAKDAQGGGLGKDNVLTVVDDAAAQGKRLNGDSSISESQYRVWRSLFDKGILTADEFPSWKELEAALKAGGGFAKAPGGGSWFRGIRRAENEPSPTPKRSAKAVDKDELDMRRDERDEIAEFWLAEYRGDVNKALADARKQGDEAVIRALEHAKRTMPTVDLEAAKEVKGFIRDYRKGRVKDLDGALEAIEYFGDTPAIKAILDDLRRKTQPGGAQDPEAVEAAFKAIEAALNQRGR